MKSFSRDTTTRGSLAAVGLVTAAALVAWDSTTRLAMAGLAVAEGASACGRVGAEFSSAQASRWRTLTECACQQLTLQNADWVRALLHVETLHS